LPLKEALLEKEKGTSGDLERNEKRTLVIFKENTSPVRELGGDECHIQRKAAALGIERGKGGTIGSVGKGTLAKGISRSRARIVWGQEWVSQMLSSKTEKGGENLEKRDLEADVAVCIRGESKETEAQQGSNRENLRPVNQPLIGRKIAEFDRQQKGEVVCE